MASSRGYVSLPWGENECCVNSIANYVMLNLACDELAKVINK